MRPLWVGMKCRQTRERLLCFVHRHMWKTLAAAALLVVGVLYWRYPPRPPEVRGYILAPKGSALRSCSATIHEDGYADHRALFAAMVPVGRPFKVDMSVAAFTKPGMGPDDEPYVVVVCRGYRHVRCDMRRDRQEHRWRSDFGAISLVASPPGSGKNAASRAVLTQQ